MKPLDKPLFLVLGRDLTPLTPGPWQECSNSRSSSIQMGKELSGASRLGNSATQGEHRSFLVSLTQKVFLP